MRFIPNLLYNIIIHGSLALCMAMAIWVIVGQHQSIYTWVTIPICFYNNENYRINAPEKIQIQLTAKRRVLSYCDLTQVALHINAADLKEGKQLIIPTARDLLVGEGISVVDYKPSNLIITRTTSNI